MKHEMMERLTKPVSARDHVKGPLDAVSTLVEYGDFECPACGEVHPLVRALQQRLGENLCFVYRHFPRTEVHPHAQDAAEVAEAAGARGRFWQMHDQLFENRDALTYEGLAELAESVGLDSDQIMDEVSRGVHVLHVQEDFASGVQSRVDGTPTFFINGFRYDGPTKLRPMLEALTDTEE